MNKRFCFLGGCFLVFVFNVNAQWTGLNGPPGGWVNDLELDVTNNKVYNVLNNHLYFSTNDGTSWTKVVPSKPTELTLDDFFMDGTTMFALSYSQLLSSTDGGVNWNSIVNNASGFSGVFKMLKVATNVYAIYGVNGVYVSKDAGVNWIHISTVNCNSAIVTASGDLYFADTDGIKRHLNPGTNPWASSNVTTVLISGGNDDPNMRVTRLALLGTTFFAIINSDVLKSTNGSIWTSSKSGISDATIYGTLAASSTGLYLFNNWASKVYFTTDGATWSATNPIAFTFPDADYSRGYVREIRFASATKIFAGMEYDGVFLTTNQGLTWSQANAGIYLSDVRDVVVGTVTHTNPRIFARPGWGSAGTWMSDDKGATWFFSGSNGTTRPPNAIAIHKLMKIPNNTLLGFSAGPLVYSTDNGNNWATAGIGSDYFDCVAFNTAFSAGFAAAPVTYLYGFSGNRLASSTTGSIWIDIAVTGLPTSYYTNGGLTQDNAGNLYTSITNTTGNPSVYEFYKIVLAGSSATAITATATKMTLPLVPNDLPPTWSGNVTGMFVNNNKVYIGSNNAIYYSTDQGTTWNATVFSNSYLMGLSNGNAICASTSGAFYVSADDGLSWSNNSLPNNTGYIRAIDYDATNQTYYGDGDNTSAVKISNVTTLVPAIPPPYINFNWTATNGPWGGITNRILVDNAGNSFAFLQPNQAIYKTTTFSSWTDVTQGNGFNDVDIDQPTNKIYAANYNQLYTSVSGGAWTLLDATENFGGISRMKRCSNGDVVLGTSDGRVYVSTNGGVSFGAVKYTIANNLNISDIQSTATATLGIFVYYYDNASNTNKVVKSVDRGVTWTALTPPAGAFIQAISGRGSVVYLTSYSDTGNDVNVSTDNGATWTSIKGDLTGNNYQHVFISPTGDLYLAAYDNSNKQGFFKSTNGGTNWTFLPATFTVNVNDVKWVGSRMVVGSNQGVFTSDDGGVTYANHNIGIPQNIVDMELASQSKLFTSDKSQDAITTDLQNWSTDGNYSFHTFARKPDGTLLAAQFPNKLYQTQDGGNTWKIISNTQPQLDLFATADGVTYYGTNWPNKIFYTSDLSTWTQLSPTGLPDNFLLYDIAADQNGLYYVVLYNFSTNVNEAYQILFGSALKIAQAKNPQNIEFSQNKIFLYDGNGSILTTTDGSTWTNNGAPGGSKFIIASQNYYFISSYGGNLWLSRDQGQTWQNVGLGTSSSNNNFNDVVVNEFNGYAYGAITNSPVRKSGNIVIPSDVIAPVVTTLSPSTNATSVGIKPALSITFDQAAVPVAGKFLRILDVASPITPVETIDVSLSVQNGKTFTFTPVNFLSFNKTYFIIVDNGGFTDIFANAWTGINSNSTWKFTTKPAPAITILAPANNATGVALTPSLTMTFSEAITPVAGKNIYLYDAAQTSTPVATIVVPNLANDFVQVTPIAASPDQAVIVTLDATKGGGELVGAASVYMHAGVITDSPTGTSWDLQHVVGNWGQDDGIGKMTAVVGSPNLWQITLGPTLRQYFSVASGTTIYSLAMVFRNSSGSIAARGPATMAGGYFATNGDAFLSLGTTVQSSVSAVGNSITISPHAPLKYFKQYFVKGDASAFQSVEGFGLSFDTNNTDWVFTTLNYPDKKPPIITYTADNLNKGAGTENISVGITDSVGVATAKIFYRKITTGNPVTSVPLVLNNSNGKYEVAVAEADYGSIGLEYYFKAADAANNMARSPSDSTKYYSYINYATGAAATNPTLPSLPSGGTAGNWKIIAIPFQLTDDNVSTIFNELGSYDKSAWRLITYKNQTAWAEYQADFAKIKQGVGYFINVKNSGSILIEGATSPNFNKETPFLITLNPGWTEIGNPYPFTVTWDEVLTASGIVTSGAPTLKTFNGTYQPATDLKAFEGGFVFNSGSAISLKFPIDAAGAGGRQGVPLHTDLDGEDWIAPIALTIGGLNSELGGVGMNPQASMSVDGFDDVTPPRFIDFLEMNFPHPEHFAKNLDRDVVPTQNEYTWDFSVDSNIKGLAKLTWDNSAFGNGGKDLILFDVALQRLIDMRDVNQYQFDPNESSHFKIYFGNNLMEKIKPSKVLLAKAYPNPTTGIAIINFTLPENSRNYNISLDVFDIMGNKVSTLVNGNLEAGFYNSTWDAALNNASNGMYIYRLVVDGQTGSEAHAGKIILKK